MTPLAARLKLASVTATSVGGRLVIKADGVLVELRGHRQMVPWAALESAENCPIHQAMLKICEAVLSPSAL